MINLIQVITVIAALLLAFYALNRRNTHSGKASKKIALVLLALAMIVAVLFPGTTTTVANMLGIGRGADLLLYSTVLVFIFYALNNYLKQQDQRDMLFRLARRLAVLEARERYKQEIAKSKK